MNNIVNIIINFVGKIHALFIFSHRTEVLSNLIVKMLPRKCQVLDIGCGNGIIDQKIILKNKDVKIIGVDVFKRIKTAIPVTIFDGKKLPFADNQFDCVLFIDVLHHTHNPEILIQEAQRVTKKIIIIKDHYAQNKLNYYTLKLMDWIGNKSHSVNLTYNYYTKNTWKLVFNNLNLYKNEEINNLHLYPFPINILFEKNLHFIVKLIKK